MNLAKWYAAPLISAAITAITASSAFASSECFTYSSSECANGQATAAATTTTVSRAATLNVARGISSNITSAMSRNLSGSTKKSNSQADASSPYKVETGLSGGDVNSPLSAWASVDYTNLKIEPDGVSAQSRKSNIYTGIVGLDYKLSNSLVTGVALSYANSNTDGHNTNFTDLDQKSDTFSVTPYVGYAVTDRLLVNGMVGYSYGSVDQENYATGVKATADNDVQTLFASVNGSYDIPVTQSMGVRPFVGYSLMKTWVEGYTDSLGSVARSTDMSHWQAQAGAQAYATFTDSTDGYLSLAYERDQHIRGVGENSVRVTMGGNTQVTDAISAGVEATANLGRETQREFGGSTNLRVAF